jgi:hypothetical protein
MKLGSYVSRMISQEIKYIEGNHQLKILHQQEYIAAIP